MKRIRKSVFGLIAEGQMLVCSKHAVEHMSMNLPVRNRCSFNSIEKPYHPGNNFISVFGCVENKCKLKWHFLLTKEEKIKNASNRVHARDITIHRQRRPADSTNYLIRS